MLNNKKILVAVDGSPESRRTVGYVADMVRGNSGLHVGLFHLKLPPRMLEWGGSENSETEEKVSTQRRKTYEQMEGEAIAKGHAMLRHLQANLVEQGIDVAAQIVQFEDPLDPKHITQHILKTAAEGGYGTVAVGRHSFSALKRFFRHYVGEELVRFGEGVAIWVVE
jgi:nucleotide-binding universal stress UspA family protein